MSISVIVSITTTDGEILEQLEVEDEGSDIELAAEIREHVERRFNFYELDSNKKRIVE